MRLTHDSIDTIDTYATVTAALLLSSRHASMFTAILKSPFFELRRRSRSDGLFDRIDLHLFLCFAKSEDVSIYRSIVSE